ncbi:MAG: tetratricopeptide repeat protein [Planctomycetes bacterium]|nr:tetratricopeptide repeat protein [Planctomycetota bacterium]
MRRAWWIAGLVLGLGGCASLTLQDRVQDYDEDGVYLFQHGDYEGARSNFQQALALNPGDSSLLYNLGECYDRLGQPVQAEKYYLECLQKTPDHHACRHALIVLKVTEGKPDEAAHMIQDWIAKEPKLATAYAVEGWYRHRQGDLPGAQFRLEQALELDPHNPQALTELGLVYEAMDRPDRALVLYERSLDQDAHQPDVAQRVQFLLTHGATRPHPDD